MADGWIIALAIGGGATALTLLDKENILGLNPSKVWWWERVFPPKVVTVVKYIERPVVAMSEPLIQSKYLVTAQTNPGDWTQPKRGAY